MTRNNVVQEVKRILKQTHKSYRLQIEIDKWTRVIDNDYEDKWDEAWDFIQQKLGGKSSVGAPKTKISVPKGWQKPYSLWKTHLGDKGNPNKLQSDLQKMMSLWNDPKIATTKIQTIISTKSSNGDNYYGLFDISLKTDGKVANTASFGDEGNISEDVDVFFAKKTDGNPMTEIFKIFDEPDNDDDK